MYPCRGYGRLSGVRMIDYCGALKQAIKRADLAVCRDLLDSGGITRLDAEEALTWAAENDRTQIIDFLIARGVNVDAGDGRALRWAVDAGHEASIGTLLRHGATVRNAAGDIALLWALRAHRFDIADLLLAAGADIDMQRGRLLKDACDALDYTRIHYLLAAGGDVNAPNEVLLLAAIKNNNLILLDLLLAHGADVHFGREEALMQAIWLNRPAIVKRLLAMGADAMARNGEAIYRACTQTGRLVILRQLLCTIIEPPFSKNEVMIWASLNADHVLRAKLLGIPSRALGVRAPRSRRSEFAPSF